MFRIKSNQMIWFDSLAFLESNHLIWFRYRTEPNRIMTQRMCNFEIIKQFDNSMILRCEGFILSILTWFHFTLNIANFFRLREFNFFIIEIWRFQWWKFRWIVKVFAIQREVNFKGDIISINWSIVFFIKNYFIVI